MKYIRLLGWIWVLMSGSVHAQQKGFSFEQFFRQNEGCFDSVLQHKKDYRLQILYTRIDRDAQNKPHLTTYNFDADKYYYYCASMVKLPAAVLTLEKINALADYHITILDSLAIDSIHCSNLSPESLMLGTGFSCIGQYIKEMLLISNNMAFNPLYDFIGQQYFQDRLHEIGCKSAVISHRFSGCDTNENRYCNAISFYDRKKHLLKYIQPCSINTRRQFYEGLLSTKVGNGYMANGNLVNEPKDFHLNNYIALSDLHQLLIKIMLPETQKPEERLRLTPRDYQYLYKCMGLYPRECAYPVLDSVNYPDHYMKYFMSLDSGIYTMPKYLRVFNKVGQAYGFMTDCSYVVDTIHKIEFFLSCSMYLNSDGILNDSKYDYDSIGYPFFHNLFQAVYTAEVQRTKTYLPKLSLPDFSDTLIAPIPQKPVWLNIDSNSSASNMETILCLLMDSMRAHQNPSAYTIFSRNLSVALRQTRTANYPFDSLRQRGLSIITAPDNRLRIFDWKSDSSGFTHPLFQFWDSACKVILGNAVHYTTLLDNIDSKSGKIYLLIGEWINGTANTRYLQAYQIKHHGLVPAIVFEVNHQMNSTLTEENPNGKAKLMYNAKKKVIRMNMRVIKKGKAKLKRVKLRYDGQIFKQ